MLSTLLLGGGLLATTAPAEAQAPRATAAASATGSSTARIALTSLTPDVPTGGDTLTVSGRVTNRGSSTLTHAHLGVRVGNSGRPLANRSAVSAVQNHRGYLLSDGVEIPGDTAKLPSLHPGAGHSFTLKVPVGDLHLQGNGVYQLSVTLLGRNKTVTYPQVLGITRTVLPWYPQRNATQHTQVTMAWPLVDRPHIDARTDSDPQQTPIFRDDDLAAELAPGGRLQRMVSLGSHLPVTWIIDPDLLATVDAMAKGYKVAGNNRSIDKAQQGTGSQAAKDWLNQLKNAVKGKDSQVVAVPFADPDLASIAHRGKGVPDTLDHLRSATDLATETTQTILGIKPRTDVAWPYAGQIDHSVVSVARSAGADKVIASSSVLGSAGLTRTPNSVRPIGGGTTALVADATLSQDFSGDMTDQGAAAEAVQQFLAQTLMITMEAPNEGRSVLVVPQRMPSASAAKAMAKALQDAETGGWVQPVGLSTLTKATPDPAADHQVPGTGSYPGRPRRQELPTDAFQQIQDTQTSLRKLLVILSQGPRVVTPFGTALLRAMSTSWRGEAGDAEEYRDTVQDYLGQLEGAVHIVDKSDVTLSGSSGTIQVTVENNLAQEVRDLHLEVTSGQHQRLELTSEQEVRLPGAHRKSYKFHASAKANGRVGVVAQLYTGNGEPYGAPVKFQVNVTSVTKTVLIVIVCGMLLLVLAGIRMYRQRKRAALRPESPDDSGDGGSEVENRPAGGSAGPGGGNPRPDISVENTEPAASDEKVDR